MQSSNSMHYCTLPRAPHRTFKKATGNILCPPLLCVCVCVCVCENTWGHGSLTVQIHRFLKQ